MTIFHNKSSDPRMPETALSYINDGGRFFMEVPDMRHLGAGVEQVVLDDAMLLFDYLSNKDPATQWHDFLDSKFSEKTKPEKRAEKLQIDEGYIYFIGTGKEQNKGRWEYHRIKIGKSKSPESRVSSIKTACPYPLDVINIVPCDNYSKVESWLHWMFNAFRVNLEWFYLDPGIIESFSKITQIEFCKKPGQVVVGLGEGKEHSFFIPGADYEL